MADTQLVFYYQPYQKIPPGDWDTGIIFGGRGLGKTWNLTRWLLTKAFLYPNTTWYAVAKTWTDADQVLANGEGGFRWHLLGGAHPDPTLPDRPNLEFMLLGGKLDAHSFPMSRGSMMIRLSNGSRIIFASADRADTLRGPNAHGAICDEVAFWDEASMDALTYMVRMELPDGTQPQLLMATTPNGANWFAKKYLLVTMPTDGVIYIGSQDLNMPPNPPPSTFANRFTAKAFRKKIERLKGTENYAQEALGMVLSLKGQVYKNISALHHTRNGRTDPELVTPLIWPTPETAEQVIAGQDLGTEHLSALIILARTGETWCAVEEVCKPAATESDWYEMIAPTLERWKPSVIYSDTNFPQTITDQKRRGLRIIDAVKSAGSVDDGIRAVNTLIANDELVVDVEKCPTLWGEFSLYRWAMDKLGEPTDKPVKADDDALDALRYAIYMEVARNVNDFYIA